MTDRFRRIALGIGATLVALGTAAALYASSQNTAGGTSSFSGPQAAFGRSGGLFGPMRMIARRLGLSDTQKDQIKTIAQAHREEWKALADRGIAARKALAQAVTADPVDEGAIRDKSSALSAVQADIAVARAHARDEIFKVLTPEQQAQARTMQSNIETRIDRRVQRFEQRFSK